MKRVVFLFVIAAASQAQNGTAEHDAQLYRTHCATCHGPAGRGDGPGGAGLPEWTSADRPIDEEGTRRLTLTPSGREFFFSQGLM